MNIEIKNFGPIDYLKIDLDKDLHLIYGKNAIGKSYVVYCVYCLLKSLKSDDLAMRESIASMINSNALQLNAFEMLFKDKSPILDIDNSESLEKLFMDQVLLFLNEEMFKEFKNYILNTFSTFKVLKNRYSNKDFELIINLSESKIIKSIFMHSKNSKSEILEIGVNLFEQKFEFVKKSPSKNRLKKSFFVLYDGKKTIEAQTMKELSEKFSLFIFQEINKIIREINIGMKDIYFLPASRSGLYQALNSFASIIAELSQNRFFTKNKSIELPALSEPVSDYFIDLSTIQRKVVNKDFESFANVIEKDILKGKVEFDEKTKKITYMPTGLDIELNLSEASSMVAELTPLVLYLRHIINHKFKSSKNDSFGFFEQKNKKGNNVLFIEEPEAHLHPEVQVQLMKVLADLAQNNLKIFITSHSNYMFNELNNLILENKIDKERIAVYHLIHGENGTIQNPEMTVTEDGIYDENFQETSEKLYEERMRILEEAANA